MASARILAVCSILALTGFLGLVLAADAPKPEQIRKWVQQLGADDFTEREEATQKLWEAGQPAEAPLREALKSEDPEVVRRARDVLAKFKWGIYPDTPKPVVELISRYHQADRGGKQTIVKELLDKGAKGCAILLKIARAEENEDVKRDLFRQVAYEASRAMPELVISGDFATLDELIEMSHQDETELAMPNYAAYWLLRGKLDEKIALAKALAAKGERGGSPQLLAYLYRAKGDLPTALTFAEKGRRDQLEGILAEQGNWKALAELAAKSGEPVGFDQMGFRAAYLRLAGDKAGLEALVERIVKQAAELTADEESRWMAAKALLVNERVEEALKLLTTSRQAPRAVEVLAGQMKYSEALAHAQKAKVEGDDRHELNVVRASTLYAVGEKDKALALLDELGKAIKEGESQTWHEELIDAEARLGLRDRALEHCGLLLANTNADGERTKLLEKVFSKKKEQAEVLWRYFRLQFPTETAPATMKRVGRLLGPRPPAKEVEDTASGLALAAKDLRPAERAQWLAAAGEMCLDAGLDDVGRGHLEAAVALAQSPAPGIRLGDHFARLKRWEQAADAYRRAWELPERTKDPLALYLQGWALAQGGSEQDGRKLMEASHWAPLGNEVVRWLFARALLEHGQMEAAQREWELLLRTSRAGGYYSGEALRQVALNALGKGNFLEAADYHERAILRVLRPGVSFVQNSSYVSVPHFIHRQRARGLAQAGRLDEALKEAAICQTLRPGDTDIPMYLLPPLEKAGRKQEADALFARALQANEKECTELPNSAWAHNSLAWLGAVCRRNLDKALEHAQKAVALAPKSAGYLDTMAEVQFQRGEKDKAIELMKQCLDMDPGKVYFRKQLKRFEAGDPLAPIPTDGEDE